MSRWSGTVGALFRNRDISILNLVPEVGHADCSFIVVLLNLLQPNAMVVPEVRDHHSFLS